MVFTFSRKGIDRKSVYSNNYNQFAKEIYLLYVGKGTLQNLHLNIVLSGPPCSFLPPWMGFRFLGSLLSLGELLGPSLLAIPLGAGADDEEEEEEGTVTAPRRLFTEGSCRGGGGAGCLAGAL